MIAVAHDANGFDTSAGFGVVAPDVAWAKLGALRSGAEPATERLL